VGKVFSGLFWLEHRHENSKYQHSKLRNSTAKVWLEALVIGISLVLGVWSLGAFIDNSRLAVWSFFGPFLGLLFF
jgi:hypothetical protein